MDRHEADDEPLERTLARAARGDADAWAMLVNTYSRRVYALVARQCGDRDLAEEIAQATFVRVVTRIGQYTEQGRFEAWLFRIAMNLLRDELRRRKRQARTIDLGGASDNGTHRHGLSHSATLETIENRRVTSQRAQDTDPVEQASRAEQVQRMREAIATMSDADQQVLHLRYTAGLSFAQIAETLDAPLGTVLARGHRALEKLRKLMQHTTA